MAAQPEPTNFAPTEHLSSEAVAAFADDRLPPTARDRALRHLGQCPECMDELHVQRSARYALRHSGPIRMPSTLAEKLAHLAEVERAEQDRTHGHQETVPSRMATPNSARRPSLGARLKSWFFPG